MTFPVVFFFNVVITDFVVSGVVVVVIVVVVAAFIIAVAFVVRLNYWAWRLGNFSVISIVVVVVVFFFNVVGGGVVVGVFGNVNFSNVGVVSFVVAFVVRETGAFACKMCRREVIEQGKGGPLAA